MNLSSADYSYSWQKHQNQLKLKKKQFTTVIDENVTQYEIIVSHKI